MIDISLKDAILRISTASGAINLEKETIKKIRDNNVKKGDPFTISRIAAINAVKKVPELIPLCHPIPINHISVDFEFHGETSIKVKCCVKSYAKTGVEMEALMGASVALLNLWDVVKMYEKDEMGQYPKTNITEIIVEEKIKKPK